MRKSYGIVNCYFMLLKPAVLRVSYILIPRSCIEWHKKGEKGKLLQLVNINQQSKWIHLFHDQEYFKSSP